MKTKIILLAVIFLSFFLRVYKLDLVPPSLYWDEASLGYNAYSISQTLCDEHGELLPLTRFIAFGDYKPPGYIYAAAVAIKLFGLNEFSVRFPSALAGTLLVLVTYFLVKELKIGNSKLDIALIAATLVAVSPWALQFSRGAFEANLATLFSGAGILFLLRAINSKKSIFYLLSSIFLALAMYTFNSHKVFVPLILLAMFVIFRKELLGCWKKTVLFGVVLLVLLIPLGVYSVTREARLRFDEVSWTKDLAPIELSNQRIARDDGNPVGKILHNRRIIYTLEFLKHYTDTFNSNFLFFKGDINRRLSTGQVGELYLLDGLFLLAGIFFLVKSRSRASAVIFAWAILAPIPAALARETPHALRTLNLLPIPQILIAVGISQFFRFRFLITILYLVSCLLYLQNYFFVYPAKYASSWQYGYKQAVQYIVANGQGYDHIAVTNLYGRPYIYFLLHSKYPPEKYWLTRRVDRDWYGFWYVYGFDKYVFGDQEGSSGKWLFVRGPNQSPQNAKLLSVIKDLEGNPVFDISEKSY